jgi:hypothetical protein
VDSLVRGDVFAGQSQSRHTRAATLTAVATRLVADARPQSAGGLPVAAGGAGVLLLRVDDTDHLERVGLATDLVDGLGQVEGLVEVAQRTLEALRAMVLRHSGPVCTGSALPDGDDAQIDLVADPAAPVAGWAGGDALLDVGAGGGRVAPVEVLQGRLGVPLRTAAEMPERGRLVQMAGGGGQILRRTRDRGEPEVTDGGGRFAL